MTELSLDSEVTQTVTHDSDTMNLFLSTRAELQTELKLLQRRIQILEKAFGVGKICPGCGKPEGVVDFGRNYSRPDGKQVYCRACRKEKFVHATGGAQGVSEVRAILSGSLDAEEVDTRRIR